MRAAGAPGLGSPRLPAPSSSSSSRSSRASGRSWSREAAGRPGEARGRAADSGCTARPQLQGHRGGDTELCALFLPPRLKQERELVLTQLSQGLAAELTELVVTECVRDTCSRELQ